MTDNKIGIDRLLLTYLYDPDKGLEQEITDLLNTQAKECEEIEARIGRMRTLPATNLLKNEAIRKQESALEVAEADLEFYTDVWVKIRAASPSDTVVAQIIEDHAPMTVSKSEFIQLNTPEAVVAYFNSLADS